MIVCVILVEKQVANFVYLMSIYDAPSIMVNLLSNENKEIRYLAFHIIHMLFIHIRTLVKSITDSRFTAQPFNVTADYCKHMEAGLNKYPGDINVINHFYDFIIATKPGNTEKGLFATKKPLQINCVSLITTLLAYVIVSKDDNLTITALNDLVALVDGPSSTSNNRVLLAALPNIYEQLLRIALYSTNDSIVHAVNVILSHLICHQTFFKANGWTSLENLRALVESYYVTTDQSEDKNENTSKSTPVVAFNQFFGQFMKCYLNLLNTKLASITIPKRTTQAGSVIFEGYAMSTVLGLNFFLSLIPDIPHSVVANPDGTPLITPYKTVKSVNDLDEPTCQMITLCLDIFNAVRPQITSINELCSIRDPTNHISLPIMANGIVPLMMRAMETETIFIMKQLFKEGGDMIEPRKKNILNRLDACEKLLYQLRVIIKEDDKQEDEQEATDDICVLSG